MSVMLEYKIKTNNCFFLIDTGIQLLNILTSEVDPDPNWIRIFRSQIRIHSTTKKKICWTN